MNIIRLRKVQVHSAHGRGLHDRCCWAYSSHEHAVGGALSVSDELYLSHTQHYPLTDARRHHLAGSTDFKHKKGDLKSARLVLIITKRHVCPRLEHTRVCLHDLCSFLQGSKTTLALFSQLRAFCEFSLKRCPHIWLKAKPL